MPEHRRVVPRHRMTASSAVRPVGRSPRAHATDPEDSIIAAIARDVAASRDAVALHDLAQGRVLAASDHARLVVRELTGRDIVDIDFISEDRDPDAVTTFVRGIERFGVDEWRFTSRATVGRPGAQLRGHARLVRGLGRRLVAVVRYDLVVDADDVDAPAPWGRPDAVDATTLAVRIVELERTLRRIADELDWGGFFEAADGDEPAVVPDLDGLSDREREIVRRLLRGERVPTIARALFLSTSTVRNYLTAVYKRFGVHSQTELLAALRRA